MTKYSISTLEGCYSQYKRRFRCLPSQEQSEIKLTRTELTLIKKLPSQIKEIVSQNARIEDQLHSLNKDIKQITQTHPDRIESRESLKHTPGGDTSNKDHLIPTDWRE
ncbi:MAG TPA: hypothetical protein VN922_24075, partial [Bacteroidia bacterium]|nr:hypothetical protein [Bacteroidia bacterium]